MVLLVILLSLLLPCSKHNSGSEYSMLCVCASFTCMVRADDRCSGLSGDRKFDMD